MDIVEAQKVSKIYKTLYGRVVALNDVNLRIGKGVTGIAGPNGSGKTTLLKITLGISTPTSGRIRVLGDSPIKKDIKMKISYLPEKPVFPKNVTVRELTKYVARVKGIPMEELISLLNYFEIYDLDRKVGALSAGMTQKIGICYTLSSSQELIILDEPTANLDPIWRKRVLEMIGEKGRQSTIIFSTHLLHDVEKVAEKIVFMNNGRILLHDDVGNVVKKYGRMEYEITLKNGEKIITDDPQNFLKENVEKIDLKKSELGDIFEVILNERAG